MADDTLGTAKLSIVVDTSNFDAAINQAKRSVSGMSQAAQDAYNKLSAAQKRQVDGLIRQANLLGKTRQEQILYNAALKGVPTSILDELKTKFSAAGSAAAAAGKELNQYGITAGQQAAALRGVPAQLTDIIVGLQGGQSPLTVALQQGGQLRDMFGGLVPAAKALGSAFLGLVNPLTLTAGGVAALALAYSQGAGESQKFNQALILTGNVSGQTAGELSDLARSISETGVTQASAARVLTQVVSSGKIATDSYREVAQAALDLESITGTAADKTLAVFERLADEPTKASAALNEQYHYLTASIYEQIAALERQGDKDQAAALAQRTYADAVIQRAQEVKANMGTLERAWDSLAGAAKGAWDAMLNIGRPTPVADLRAQAKAIQDQIAQLQGGDGFATNAGGAAFGGGGNARAQALKRLQTQLAPILQQIADDEKKSADARAAAEAQAANDAKISAQSWVDDLRKSSRSRAQIRDEEVAQVRKNAAILGLSVQETQRLIDQVNAKYKDPAAKAFTDDAATKMLASLREQAAAMQDQLESSTKLTAQQQALAKFEQQIADLKNKAVLTADQKSLLANEDAIRTQLQANVALGDQVKLKQESLQLDERARQLLLSIQSAQTSQGDQYARQLAGAGRGSQEQERIRSAQTLVRQYQRYQDQLTKATPKDLLGSDQYRQASQEISDQLDLALADQQDYYRQLDQLQSDWKTGASSALEDYADSIRNVAASTSQAFSDGFKGAEDAIVKFAQTGKLSVSDMANSIIADLIRISVRSSITGPLAQYLGQAIGGYFAGGSSAGIGAATATDVGNAGGGLMFLDDGGYTGPGGKYDLAGFVHRGEVVWSQEDVARAGGVGAVEAMRQGFRGYADGGPVGRAAVPLTSMQGSRQGAAPQIEVNVINQSGQPVQASQGNTRIDGDRIVTEVFLKDVRTNGPMTQQIKNLVGKR
ncbi:phage tail tape measure protein [Bordetella bronchialis]|uniref:Phage tail tape measure protein n=1 Tax=Bordetella bronchialis TaxID=463025 RepID=A0A193FWJ4_9BORD|nr:phage tail tape measure protein [Bordetella bronchialis]ANN71551.1 phage tail tape measure protein [Bordetella bronchialis]